MNTLLEALGALDPQNDEHWTQQGAPRITVLEVMLGMQPGDLKRQEVTDAAPQFSREDPRLPGAAKRDEELSKEEAADPGVALEEARVQEETARKARETAEKAMDKAIEEKVAKEPPTHVQNMQNIRAYLDRQHENRARRAEQFQKANELLGGQLGTRPRSVLDAAMERKTQRGTERPPAPEAKTG